MSTFKLGVDFLHPTATVEPCKGDNGAHIEFPNGWVVSVQWGPCTYSSNYDTRFPDVFPGPPLSAEKAEIAAWHGTDGMIVWPDGDTVQGWKTWDEVQAVLDQAETGTLAAIEATATDVTSVLALPPGDSA